MAARNSSETVWTARLSFTYPWAVKANPTMGRSVLKNCIVREAILRAENPLDALLPTY
jgi:hypothetical protein